MSSRIFPLLSILFLFIACSDHNPVAPADSGKLDFEFTFAVSDEGFSAGFAEYPEGAEQFYELASGYQPLPAGFETGRKGYFITGSNHSDDLFMFVKKKLGPAEGILPNTIYELSLKVGIATSAGLGCAGIGGSPGESVYFKAGAATVEPKAINDKGFYQMNVDKGQQGSGGYDAAVIGNIAHELNDCSGSTWHLKNLFLDQFRVRSSGQGELWLILGTDSGFEGITGIYLTRIEATLEKTDYTPLPGKEQIY